MNRINLWLKAHPMTTWQWYNWLVYFCFAGLASLGVFYLGDSLIGRHQPPNDEAALALVCASVLTVGMFLFMRLAKKP